MTSMTRFSPFRSSLQDVAVLQNRLNSIFQDFSRPLSATEGEGLGNTGFVPAVDIYEDAHNLTLKLEVPGIRQEDLDIRVENQTLTIRGERKFDSEQKEENFHRIERRYGSFVRSFTLPQSLDTEAVKASYEHGVLTVSLPKKAEAKPRQIKVEVGSSTSAPAPKQVEAKPAA